MQNEGRAGQKGCAAGFSSKFPSVFRRKSSGPNGGFFRHPRGREARSLSGRFRVRFSGLADPAPSPSPGFSRETNGRSRPTRKCKELIALSAITCPAKLCETCQKNFPPFFDVKIEEIML
jgi:hypothetical protein